MAGTTTSYPGQARENQQHIHTYFSKERNEWMYVDHRPRGFFGRVINGLVVGGVAVRNTYYGARRAKIVLSTDFPGSRFYGRYKTWSIDRKKFPNAKAKYEAQARHALWAFQRAVQRQARASNQKTFAENYREITGQAWDPHRFGILMRNRKYGLGMGRGEYNRHLNVAMWVTRAGHESRMMKRMQPGLFGQWNRARMVDSPFHDDANAYLMRELNEMKRAERRGIPLRTVTKNVGQAARDVREIGETVADGVRFVGRMTGWWSGIDRTVEDPMSTPPPRPMIVTLEPRRSDPDLADSPRWMQRAAYYLRLASTWRESGRDAAAAPNSGESNDQSQTNRPRTDHQLVVTLDRGGEVGERGVASFDGATQTGPTTNGRPDAGGSDATWGGPLQDPGIARPFGGVQDPARIAQIGLIYRVLTNEVERLMVSGIYAGNRGAIVEGMAETFDRFLGGMFQRLERPNAWLAGYDIHDIVDGRISAGEVLADISRQLEGDIPDIAFEDAHRAMTFLIAQTYGGKMPDPSATRGYDPWRPTPATWRQKLHDLVLPAGLDPLAWWRTSEVDGFGASDAHVVTTAPAGRRYPNPAERLWNRVSNAVTDSLGWTRDEVGPVAPVQMTADVLGPNGEVLQSSDDVADAQGPVVQRPETLREMVVAASFFAVNLANGFARDVAESTGALADKLAFWRHADAEPQRVHATTEVIPADVAEEGTGRDAEAGLPVPPAMLESGPTGQEASGTSAPSGPLPSPDDEPRSEAHAEPASEASAPGPNEPADLYDQTPSGSHVAVEDRELTEVALPEVALPDVAVPEVAVPEVQIADVEAVPTESTPAWMHYGSLAVPVRSTLSSPSEQAAPSSVQESMPPEDPESAQLSGPAVERSPHEAQAPHVGPDVPAESPSTAPESHEAFPVEAPIPEALRSPDQLPRERPPDHFDTRGLS